MTTTELDNVKTRLIDTINHATSLEDLSRRVGDILLGSGRISGVPRTLEEVRQEVDAYFRRKDAGELTELTTDEVEERLSERMPWLR